MIRFTAREILILIQLIELAREDESIFNIPRASSYGTNLAHQVKEGEQRQKRDQHKQDGSINFSRKITAQYTHDATVLLRATNCLASISKAIGCQGLLVLFRQKNKSVMIRKAAKCNGHQAALNESRPCPTAACKMPREFK